MFSAWVTSAVALLVFPVVPVFGQQQEPVVADFLTTIGGNTSAKTVGADKNPAAPKHPLLTRDAADIVGHRFFKENMGVKRPVAVARAQATFAQECRAKGGRLLAEDDTAVRAFHQRSVAPILPKGEAFHVWKGQASICADPSGRALGGLVAISESKGIEPSNHSGSSALVGLLMPSYVRTAIYAYHPRSIAAETPAMTASGGLAESQQQIAGRFAAQRRLELKRDDAFRQAMEVGTETNCGTVIQVRGPMVEVAVPPMRTTPTGQSTFWSRKMVLFPPGPTVCTFGL